MSMLTISNDDIFISYCRSDATTYSDGLATELTKKNFIPFTDALGTDASPDLPGTLIKKLYRCNMLVILGSPHACNSVAVAEEIRLFTKAKGGTSGIILIDFGETVNNASWKELVVGLRREKESLQALITGNPSPAIVNRIDKAFTYRKSKDRIKNYIRTAAIILALLVVAIAGATYYANRQLQKAQRQEQVAAALRYANESQAMLQNPDLIVGSVQKAIRSATIIDSLGEQSFMADNALRTSLSYLPLLKNDTTWRGKEFYQTPDGKLIERKNADTTWLFYRSGENRPFFQLSCNGSLCDPYSEVAISNEGHYIAIGYQGWVRIYNTADKSFKEYTVAGEDNSVGRLGISANGKYLSISIRRDNINDPNMIKIWDHSSDRMLDLREFGAVIESISFSANGASLAMGGTVFDNRGAHSGIALIWDVSDIDNYFDVPYFNNPQIFTQQAQISNVAAGPAYTSFATVQNAHITLWKLQPGNVYRPESYMPNTAMVHSLTFSNDGGDLTILKSVDMSGQACRNIVEVWDAAGYAEMVTWYDNTEPASFRDQPRQSLCEYIYTKPEGTGRFVNGGPGSRPGFRREDIKYISNDLATVITGKDSLYIWKNGRLFNTVPVKKEAGDIGPLTITSNGRWLAWIQSINDQKATGVLMRLENNRYSAYFTFAVDQPVTRMVVGNDGSSLFLMDEYGNTTIWDLLTKKPEKLLFDSTWGRISFIQPAPGSGLLCVGNLLYDKKTNEESYGLHIWDSKKKQVMASVSRPFPFTQCTWSPDEKMLLYSYAGRLEMIKTDEQRSIHIADSSTSIHAMAFSVSGKYFGIGTGDLGARIFNTASLGEVARVGTEGKTIDIVFSRDDRYLATASDNTTFLDLDGYNNVLQLWQLQPADLVQEARRRLKAMGR
jgi:WD40 repeat protein